MSRGRHDYRQDPAIICGVLDGRDPFIVVSIALGNTWGWTGSGWSDIDRAKEYATREAAEGAALTVSAMRVGDDCIAFPFVDQRARKVGPILDAIVATTVATWTNLRRVAA